MQSHRSWKNQDVVFLVGPGGVGKSSLGSLLAPRMDRVLLDLDLIFCDRIGTIGPYIDAYGYEAYRAANLRLATHLVGAPAPKCVFVTSSGFLAAAPGTQDRASAQALLGLGYVITLMPSSDIDEASHIVVERQIRRPFGFVGESEDRKFRARVEAYCDAADLLVVSQAPAEVIADAVAAALA